MIESKPELIEASLKLEQANPCLIDECKLAAMPSQLAIDCFVATDLILSQQTCSRTVPHQDLLRYTSPQEKEV